MTYRNQSFSFRSTSSLVLSSDLTIHFQRGYIMTGFLNSNHVIIELCIRLRRGPCVRKIESQIGTDTSLGVEGLGLMMLLRSSMNGE